MYSFGVDIGGMSIKIGLVDENGHILEKRVIKTDTDPDLAIENIAKQLNDILEVKNITINEINGIGLGCPGAVDGSSGIIDILPNLGWENVEIEKKLKKYFNTKITFSNDANVAVLAEVKYGCAKNYKNALMFTLGTGVGGGIIIDGKLYEGNKCKGAELGHITLVLDGLPCTCGRKGCVERYVSATALMEQTKLAMQENKNSLMWKQVNGNINNVDGKTAFECCKQGDESAKLVVNTYVKYLAESMMNLFNIFRPEIFILGGGISNQGQYLLDMVIEYCEKFNYGYLDTPKVKIAIATLGNDAGIIGASALV
ncbi:MAG: ROK family protein [Clostridia bacterium]|nr:ROK family protein [Clostridia bacterium]